MIVIQQAVSYVGISSPYSCVESVVNKGIGVNLIKKNVHKHNKTVW